MKKYRKTGQDIFEVLKIDGKEVGVANRTRPLRKQIEAFERLHARQKK